MNGDVQLREAFEPARRLEPTEAEVGEAISRAGPARAVRRTRRALVVAAAGALLLAAAAAAGGVLPVGTVISGEGFGGNSQPVSETVVARGNAPRAGRWVMTTFATDTGVRCLKLRLAEADAAPARGGYCGYLAQGDVLTYGGRGAAVRRGEVLLYGRAGKGVRHVTLTGAGGRRIRARAELGPPSEAGRFWLIPAPPDVENARIAFTDAGGRLRGRRVDVSSRFGAPVRPTVVASGARPIPWALRARVSRRSSVDGDIYEPEGLPCLDLLFPDRPGGKRGFAAGACGEQRRTPGFFHMELPIRPLPEKPGDLLAEPLGVALVGRTPARAVAIRLVAPGLRRTVRTTPGPAAFHSDFYYLAAPPTLRTGSLQWIGRGGERGPVVRIEFLL